MDALLLKRKNTIGITYEVGEIKDHHYETIIEKILGVPESDVIGIDDRGETRFLFEVSKKEIYDRICEQFTGRDIPLGNNNVIQVDDISSYGTRIEISRVPFMIENNMLKIILQQYGEIYKCQNYYRKFGKYSKLNKTGDRIVWMKLYDQIPQKLNIKKTEMTINVQYENQPMSCNKCGMAGHRARYCSVKPDEYKNVIDMEELIQEMMRNEEIYLDDESESEDKDSDVDEIQLNMSLDKLDIHLEPSQQSNIFECNECEYQCNYENIFKEHIETHKGENTLACSKCNYQSKNRLDLNKHMKTHTGEILFKCDICKLVSKDKASHENHISTHKMLSSLNCSVCDFKCGNNDVLSNHLKIHNIHACNKCEYVSNSMQGLNGHTKIHNQKLLSCSKCEYTCSTISKLNTHMRMHTEEDVSQVEKLVEIMKSSASAKTHTKSASKRDLSISPEIVNLEKKTTKKNHCKKPKS